MDKSKTPDFQPSAEEEQKEDFSHAHPLMRASTQSSDLLEKALRRKDADDWRVKEIEQWKMCVNAVASSDNGKMLLRSMIQYAGYQAPPDVYNANKMVINTIKGAFYTTWIRPYLQPEVRKELE